ncbi:EAL domain-containing protein [Ureibacillus composti]|nr:EAL domain-containing protein [Ureibacillus composti]
MYKAIHQDLLELYYQPKIDIKSNKMIGMEALLRWHDSELGQIPPNKFIPIAEESGLICDIGEWVLRKASLQIIQWKEQYGLNLRVAVNISPTHFEEPCFIDRLKIIIEETKIDPKNLEIEITELSMMHYTNELINKIKKLKDLGLTISIDDFGTGYSSLSYLKNFPVDTLKIDRSFIVSMIDGDSNIAMVSAIISLAHALKMNVVAEGVETEYELEILKKHHCEFVQGYYFSKPLSVSDFDRFLENNK